ncbi:M23 family metallopeptidase [Bacillus sp. HMF5848]|uniref:M23 family metallopeptidase n=1 Tax=Bacillus sp. HMF5848 TaxID=2495421 RepID=UPI0016396108|nr:M23 family metallopeptidase [Bacillus sp. HMF5848]
MKSLNTIQKKITNFIKPIVPEDYVKLHKDLLRKAIVTTTAVVSLTVAYHTVSAENPTSRDMATIYHVYVNDNYVGTVNNKEVVEATIQKKINSKQGQYAEEYEWTIGNDIEYVEETAFRPSFNNEQTIKNVQSSIQVLVETAAIVVNNEPVAYLEDLTLAQEAIKQLKLKYIDEQTLSQVEKSSATTEALPPLQEGESRIIDVELSKDVAIETVKAKPTDILTVDQVVALLQKGTLEEKKYEVQEGDVLGLIANEHNLTLKQILSLNPDIQEDTVLQIGQPLNVTVYEPYVEVVVKKEVYERVSIPYQREVKQDDTIYKGDIKVQQDGKEGEKLVNKIISIQNGQPAAEEVIQEEILQAPVNEIVLKGTKVIPSRGTGNFLWPTYGGYISSKQGYRWGKFHKGIDIAQPYDRTIRSSDNGIVEFAGWDGGYGKKVVVNHRNGYKTIYAHLSNINVSVGDTVERGRKLGIMGSTGNSTGIHLHFEIYKNGRLQNPLDYVR